MKVSEYWINEFFDKPVASVEAMSKQLTMLGLEVESVQKRADNSRVVIGYVQSIEPHPNANKLQVCQVITEQNSSEKINIVCGASNVTVGSYVPVALIGAQLTNGLIIEETELRGVISQGMICSQKELGLAEESQGIAILPAQPQDIGRDFSEWAQLDDHIIDLSITPNRGDCLSMKGVARELGAIFKQPLQKLSTISPQTDQHQLTMRLEQHAKHACPRYFTCWLQGVDNQAHLPFYMLDRLQRCDIRSVNPVVDILNYIMLELGQPMHAFAVNSIQAPLQIRYAYEHEKLLMLGDDAYQNLDTHTLVIADQQKPLAMAGVKGGAFSSVEHTTTDILLESAYFEPTVISGVARRYGLNTESAYRFERGVDFELPEYALRRAIGLIQFYLGGQAGPIHGVEAKEGLPERPAIELTHVDIERQLGLQLNNDQVNDYLQRLQMQVSHNDSLWSVVPPSWRFDITINNDLLEELARLYGYNNLSSKLPSLSPSNRQQPLQRGQLLRIKHLLQDLGYQEAINYSFIEPEHNAWLSDYTPVTLSNPIASDMSQMRVSLWPGLLMTVQHNLNRQQHYLRLFEAGLCFYRTNQSQIIQKPMIAGVQVGSRMPEHWSITKTPASDVYDLKGSVEQILERQGMLNRCHFQPADHSMLHPGQTARIDCQNQVLGYLGRLHPSIASQLDLSAPVYLFELDESLLQKLAESSTYQTISKYPSVRRDFAFIVNDTVLAKDVEACIRQAAGQWLVDINFFDIFKGESIGQGLKSMAVSVTWQHPNRTFQEDEIQALCNAVMQTLNKELAAKIRN